MARLILLLMTAQAGAQPASLFDAYSALQFRNPPDSATSRSTDVLSHKEQCVLYSEIDNVSSINKGWDIGSGVGWNISYPYHANNSVPPTGIRSAVPLGGMATGNFELRADGTFRQWCIESQSPSGAAKLDIGALNDAVLGVRVGNKAALLRTAPPNGLPGVDSLTYEGAVPVSKLTIDPKAFDAALALYAHGEIVPWNHNGSLTPAVAFTLTVHNPTDAPTEASLLLSLPLAAQPETARVLEASTTRVETNYTTAVDCLEACHKAQACSAWSLRDAKCELITGGVPQNVYEHGTVSGIKGQWSLSETGTLAHDRAAAAAPPPPPAPPPSKYTCADSPEVTGQDITGTVVQQPSPSGGGSVSATPVAEGQNGYEACRSACCGNPLCKAWVVASPSAPPGATPAPCVHGEPCCWHKGGDASLAAACSYCTSSVWNPSDKPPAKRVVDEQVGNFALHVPQQDGGSMTAMTAETLLGIWEQFSSPRDVKAAVSPTAIHGAVSSTVLVPAGGNRTLTIVFGWHFKTRYFSGEPIGNYYTHLHQDSSSAATGLASRLPHVVGVYQGWHAAFFESISLPTWLQDITVNSMSQWRSAFMTADGRWRQYEAYDCVDVDSVHNDYQRQMPYALFFPDFVKNTMLNGWRPLQQEDGMITESLSGGCMGATGTLDKGGGRVMGDVSTIYLIETLQLYEWTNDEDFLSQMKESVLKAADWFMNVGTAGSPLPHKQCCTYDIIDFANYDHTTYNSFIYLAALRAGERLATHFGNQSFGDLCRSKAAAATPFMIHTLWNSTSGYFRAWQDSQLGAPPWVMADTLYGQVIANTLGLTSSGTNTTWIVPPEMILSHLKTEASFNPSPYGLTVVTTSGAPPPPATGVLKATTCKEAVGVAKYDSVWMGGAPDWATLQIALGDEGVGIETALGMAQKELDHWRTGLRDQWNIHGLTANNGYGVDGQPWCTAHYGFHMPLWHIPFALSGQRFSALQEGTLTFAPKLPCPFTLPFLTPGGVGTMDCAAGVFTLKVTLGKLTVGTLSMQLGKQIFTHAGPVSLDVGQNVRWST